MAAKRGLGKGLDSLIVPKVPAQKNAADAALSEKAADASAQEVLFVPIEKIEPDRSQPRKQFDEESLQELADSISQHGILQPLLVAKRDDYYEIIAGERRWRAAKMAKQKAVPVLIREVSERDRREMALIENLQREDLNPIEEACAYRQLIDDYQLTQEEVARRVAKSRTAVTNTLRLLKLDDRVQEMLSAQRISPGHARALLSVKKKDEQYRLALEIEEKGLSVREIEQRLQNRRKQETQKAKTSAAEKKSQEQKDAIYRKIEERLCEKLGTKVKIHDTGGKGTIEISYYSPEELEQILDSLQS